MNWIPIIFDIALPVLLKCLQQQTSQTPQEYIADHYDAETGKLDRRLVKDAIPSTMYAIRKAHREAKKEDRKSFPKFSRDDVYALTEQRLIDSMTATEEEVARVSAIAANMGDIV